MEATIIMRSMLCNAIQCLVERERERENWKCGEEKGPDERDLRSPSFLLVLLHAHCPSFFTGTLLLFLSISSIYAVPPPQMDFIKLLAWIKGALRGTRIRFVWALVLSNRLHHRSLLRRRDYWLLMCFLPFAMCHFLLLISLSFILFICTSHTHTLSLSLARSFPITLFFLLLSPCLKCVSPSPFPVALFFAYLFSLSLSLSLLLP